MTCSISLGPNDDFELITPAGRRVYIPISPHGVKELWTVLWNASAERRPRTTYATGPARELDNLRLAEWNRIEAENAEWNKAFELELEKRRQARAERKTREVVDKFGFDLKDLDLDI